MRATPGAPATPPSALDRGVFYVPGTQAAHTHLLDTAWDGGERFLRTWHAWQSDPQRPAQLIYTAVAPQAPLAAPALPDGADAALQPLAQQLAAQWRGLLPGVHRLVFDQERVQLTLHLLPLRDALASLDTAVDGLWLQGLAPDDVPATLKTLARLCRVGATLWCDAPDAVRHGLSAQGWLPLPAPEAVSLHTHAPRWNGPRHLRTGSAAPAAHALVVGGGLAGSGVAHALARRGWRVQVLDRAEQPAGGASGLPVGLVAPHVSPDDAGLSRLSRQGVRSTLARAQLLLSPGRDWAASGVLEHRVEGKRALPAPERWPTPWGPDWSRDATAAECAATGLPDAAQGLWHGSAGWIRPAALVQAQLRHPQIAWHGGCEVAALQRQGADWLALDAHGRVLGQAPHLVLANAFDSGRLLHTVGHPHLPVHALRGQVSWGPVADLPPAARALLPPHPVNGHGSFVHGMPGPTGEPIWLVGSTFERGATEGRVKPEDQDANRLRLDTLLPALAQAMPQAFDRAQAWAGVRCTLPDRLPAVGPVDPLALPGLHVCAGLGARGLTLSVLCGELLGALLHGEPWPLERKLAQALLAERFLRGAQRG